MKKKVIIAATALMLATTSVVSAAAMWGKYKGYEIVRVNVNGEKVNYQKTPALNVDGINMIPTSTLTKLGVNFTFDSNNKTLNIKGTNSSNDYISYNKNYIKNIKNTMSDQLPIESIAINNDDVGTYIKFDVSIDDTTDAGMYYIIPALAAGYYAKEFSYVKTDIFEGTTIVFSIQIDASTAKQYYKKLIGEEELIKRSITHDYTNSNQNNSSQNNVSSKIPELYSNDLKTYLGKLTTNEYDIESIFNEYGTYGSEYGANSIFNEYGTYGGKYSNQSPFNEYATKPPAIVQNGKVIGYLTLNSTIKGAISPAVLVEWLEDNGY